MADLDAELLALAGDDSSDEEVPQTTAPEIRHDSPPSSGGSPSHLNNSAPALPHSRTTKKPTPNKAKTSTKKVKRGKKDDSEEEGEASSSPESPNTLDSAPMSESEAENSAGGEFEQDGPLYPLENKFKSERDKAELMALPEVQRESILAERAQEIDRRQQSQILQSLYQKYNAKEGEKTKLAESKKRKAGAADLQESQRKSTRTRKTLGGRKAGETSDLMESYKRQREQKGILNEQRKREGEERKERKRRGSLDDGFSDADADGESEVEWNDGKQKSQPQTQPGPRDELPADLSDYNHVKVGRDNFAQVCFNPGFDDVMKNCFARLSIGVDKATGDNIYRLAQIKGITEGKPYAMEGQNGRPFITNQYVLLAHGNAQREWPFIACSNGKITESELAKYIRTMQEDNLPLATKPALIKKIDEIDALIKHEFTPEQINEKLRRSGVLDAKFASVQRSALQAQRKDAVARGDEAAIAKIDAELAALDGPKLAFGTSLTKPAKSTNKGQTQQERLAELNRINRKANTADVRKAQQAERKAEALAREAIARGEAVANPFARVKTRAKIHHDSSELLNPIKLQRSKDNSRAASPLPADLKLAGSSAGSRGTTPGKEIDFSKIKPASGTVRKGPFLAIASRNDDDDMMSAIATEIGIEIEI